MGAVRLVVSNRLPEIRQEPIDQRQPDSGCPIAGRFPVIPLAAPVPFAGHGDFDLGKARRTHPYSRGSLHKCPGRGWLSNAVNDICTEKEGRSDTRRRATDGRWPIPPPGIAIALYGPATSLAEHA